MKKVRMKTTQAMPGGNRFAGKIYKVTDDEAKELCPDYGTIVRGEEADESDGEFETTDDQDPVETRPRRNSKKRGRRR